MTSDVGDDTRRVIRRLAGGTVGGVLQAACSHPLDTIKSRVQHGVFPSVRACCRATWRAEGVRGFYRGVTPPLALGGLYNSILFSVNQCMTNLLTPAGRDGRAELPLWRTALAAQLTAPVYVLCITPMETVKVRLQVRRSADGGPLRCARHIVATDGAAGLLAGYVPTALSRIVGLPFYFAGYQAARRRLGEADALSSPAARELAVPMLSGCVAGVLFWLSNYPFDYIKTQMQAAERRRSMSAVAAETYRRGGVRGFYKGLTPCLIRAFPANASVWVGVEWTTRFLQANGF